MLYEHQKEGARQLASQRKLYLGDTPGTGKTRTVLAGLEACGARRPLVVCPAIVRTHWLREADVLAPMLVPVPIVKSYDEIVRGGFRLMRDLLAAGVDALVLDEAHFAKHANAKRTQLLLGRDGYARRVGIVCLASGTPFPKNPAELFTQLCYVFPETLQKYGVPTYERWLARYCVTRGRMVRGAWVEKVVGVANAEELQRLLGEVMLRRTLDDVGLDVPPIDWQVLRLDPALPSGTYWTDEREALDETRAALAIEALESIAADPHVARMRRRLGELKVAPVAEMLRSQLADSDEKVVVFAHHRSVLGALHEMLDGFGVAYVDGDTPPRTRTFEIDRFQADPHTRVFLGQTIACQTGITLTAARRVVLVEPDWTAVVNAQAGHRVARIGQTARRCVVQMVALSGTLDEAIVQQNARETRMAAEVLAPRHEQQAGPHEIDR